MLNTLNCPQGINPSTAPTTREKSSYESRRAVPCRSYWPCRCICVRWDICDRSVAGRVWHRIPFRRSGIARLRNSARACENRPRHSVATRNKSHSRCMLSSRTAPSYCATAAHAGMFRRRTTTADRCRRTSNAASANDSPVPTDSLPKRRSAPLSTSRYTPRRSSRRPLCLPPATCGTARCRRAPHRGIPPANAAATARPLRCGRYSTESTLRKATCGTTVASVRHDGPAQAERRDSITIA